MGGRWWGPNRSEWEAMEAHARIRSLYKQGETVSFIANVTNYSERQVDRIVRKAGLERRIIHRKTTEEDRAKIRELARAGMSFAKIQKTMGRGHRIVRPIVDAAGIKRRPAGKRWPGDRTWWPGKRKSPTEIGRGCNATVREQG